MNTIMHDQLTQLAHTLKNQDVRGMISTERSEAFSLSVDRLYFNYSRNAITESVMTALFEQAKHCKLRKKIDDMFAGKTINIEEKRSVKHWLLRAPLDSTDTDSIAVHNVLDKMEALCEKIDSHELLNQPVTDIICIGVGGSELGSRLVYEALTMGKKKSINVQFVANIDGMAIADALTNCKPQSTLFLVISKTFTTFETSKNFSTIKQWFCAQDGLNESDFWQRSCAITANSDAAHSAGFPTSQIFAFWDWVGGRYSLWSAVGLPIAIACGMSTFRELLAGAHAIDEHFKTADFNDNLPVILGLLHVWYSSYLNYPTRGVIAYAQNLKSLPEFLQQLEMESLGKSVNNTGQLLDTNTCPVVWGAAGVNAQHAFFQLLHQGTQIVPLDFIATLAPCDDVASDFKEATQEHHTALLANCLAQSQSLMHGGDTGHNGHGQFAGNRPSNLLLLDKLDAYSLGQLLAVYEHKVLVQSTMWDINAFDQFGVELGKQMCNDMLSATNGKFDLNAIKKQFEH